MVVAVADNIVVGASVYANSWLLPVLSLVLPDASGRQTYYAPGYGRDESQHRHRVTGMRAETAVPRIRSRQGARCGQSISRSRTKQCRWGQYQSSVTGTENAPPSRRHYQSAFPSFTRAVLQRRCNICHRHRCHFTSRQQVTVITSHLVTPSPVVASNISLNRSSELPSLPPRYATAEFAVV